MNEPFLKSQWQAVWAFGRKDAIVYTVRGVTERGVYVTPNVATRSPGHLYSMTDFFRMFRAV